MKLLKQMGLVSLAACSGNAMAHVGGAQHNLAHSAFSTPLAVASFASLVLVVIVLAVTWNRSRKVSRSHRNDTGQQANL